MVDNLVNYLVDYLGCLMAVSKAEVLAACLDCNWVAL